MIGPAQDEELVERPLVEVERLSKTYSGGFDLLRQPRVIRAVADVSFSVQRGETLGLVGESGSGKSSLGRAVVWLSPPTEGVVRFAQRELGTLSPAKLREARKHIQMIFQDPYASLDPLMTVRDIVGEGLDIHRLCRSRSEQEDRVATVLTRVGLSPDVMRRYPHEFSGGQRQRIGIARALVVGPEFIVCDEPVSALDVSVQAQVINLFEELQEELSLSLLFISHDLRVVAYSAHRMAVMYLGRIVELGPTREVAERRLHPYTRMLFRAAPSMRGPGVGRGEVIHAESAPSEVPPRGCGFFPRCPRRQLGTCDAFVPELAQIGTGSSHRVACFHPETE